MRAARTARRIGFTLIELMIVMAVITILASLLIFGTGIVQKMARDVQREQFMKGITVGLEAYKADYNHYPFPGDGIPGGAVVSANNSFNVMMAALGQNRYLQSAVLLDPEAGALFSSFNGVDSYNDGPKFHGVSGTCGGSPVTSHESLSGSAGYSYFTPDGGSFTLCLMKESGGVTMYTSPM